MAAKQASYQPPVHGTLLRIKDPRSKCDQCHERVFDTTVYRCLNCEMQYCILCWQSKLRDDDGQHLCKEALTASAAASGFTRLTEQALNQPTFHLLKVETTNASCDQCRKTTPDTTLWRCVQQNCMVQYCNACWQSQSRDGEGKHLCNQASTVSMRASAVEKTKPYGKVAIPSLKRKPTTADVDGNEDHVQKRAYTTGAANPTKETTQESKKQRKDGIQVPDTYEDLSHSGVEVGDDLHDALPTQ